MKKVQVAELVLDFTLYPRNNIDSGNVGNICEAIRSGIELPPLVVERTTRRVVDGFHRVKAYMREEVEKAFAIEKEYRSDAELFKDAMKFNGSHGAKLDTCDRTHCLIVAERLSLSLEDVAEALHMTVARLEDLRNERTGRNASGDPLPLKNTIRKQFKGRKLTKRQERANERLSGMNQAFYANQLIELIESDMLDKDNEELMARLKMLHELLTAVLEE